MCLSPPRHPPFTTPPSLPLSHSSSALPLLSLLPLFHPPNPLRHHGRGLCLPTGTLYLIFAYKTENPEPFIDDCVSRPDTQKIDPVRQFSSSTTGVHDSCRFYILTGLRGLTGTFLKPVRSTVQAVGPVRISKP
ncbi:Cytochrome P450 superfamily protein [Actinidia rufa]|uniref:Cytochrome P450 superfamily protein n=1 Tax=Actinidia rufa TaxID=165716 RepID=A0A7J0FFZ7_9ERIC|nr:Cytochrome P450 superfamily protein [Actinidia rufa]